MEKGMSSGSVISAVGPMPLRWRDPAAQERIADFLAALVAAALPWSTSLVAIFAVAWLIAVAPTLDPKTFKELLKRPICALPVALFLLAVVGTLWSDAPWGTRFHAIGPTVKLLVLPVLIYHFERSTRGAWVFVAFLVSCSLLMAVSWIVAFNPNLSLKPPGPADRGIFVKNYIDQSQEFALCAVALAYPIVNLLGKSRFVLATLLAAIALSFISNMAFVIVSRTALVTMPIMLAVFALIHLKWRNVIIVFCSMAVLAGFVWVASPNLQAKTATFWSEYRGYRESNSATSIGLRLEFWRKSLLFFLDAPIAGNGTGSTRGLFERTAGQTGASAEVIGNPHNQTLNVAVQWGAIGIVVLYAMWLAHLLMFRGDGLANWIGLLVVVQNVSTSLFNSHLFDFHEGWMYVLGVGTAAGMTLKTKFGKEKTIPENSVTR
jgi:O-antigen ligase